MSDGSSLWRAVRGIVTTALTDQGSGAGLGYMFSAPHLRDFLDEQYLLGPLAAFLFVPAAVCAAMHRRTRGTGRASGLRQDDSRSREGSASGAFLCLAAAVFLAASWTASDPALGYARDWDLFAPTGVTYSVAGLYLLATQVRAGAARARLLACGLLLSFLHLGAWVLVDHSEARSMARFVHLPLGQGRTEVVVGSWHFRNGRTDEAVTWFEKALRANPRNPSAYAFLGYIDAQRGRMDRAADAYREAIQYRPDKPDYRHNEIQALEALGRYAETLPHYEMLARDEPETIENWLGYARALRTLGREPAARDVLQRALARFEAARRRQPDDFERNIDVGALLSALDRREDALECFQRALRVQPDSDTALYNVGSMLVHLGRGTEARPYLERLLQLHPDHFTKDEVRGWLAQIGGKG